MVSMVLDISLGDVVVSAIATWRLTHALWGEDGPWDIFVKLRSTAGSGFLGGLLDCFYCLSLWIALPLALFVSDNPIGVAVAWPAIAGGGVLLERLTMRNVIQTPAAAWSEFDPEIAGRPASDRTGDAP